MRLVVFNMYFARCWDANLTQKNDTIFVCKSCLNNRKHQVYCTDRTMRRSRHLTASRLRYRSAVLLSSAAERDCHVSLNDCDAIRDLPLIN